MSYLRLDNISLNVSRFRILQALSLTVILLASLTARAQLDKGAVTGTLRDVSGSVLPGASVTVRNIATGIATTVTTNADGTYQVLALNPGTYSIEASASGFGTAKNAEVEVHVKGRAEVDFTLQLGAVSQQVEVRDSAAALQTQSADVGTTIGTTQINDLPLNARRYADLALLSPGIFKNPSVANAAPDRFSSNGNSETQNYFALDGVDNNSGSTNLQEGSVQNVQPPPDAIQEFRVQTRTYSTEFGTSAGAVINASIKSGTNRFHGNAWEYARNSVFDSNTYFNRQKRIPKGAFSQNQFGGTIGGPIFHDRTFFFADYQGLRSSQRVTKSSVVPSARMKLGDFGELSPTVYPLRSVATGQAGCLTTATMQIAASCLDPVALKLAALFPDPNDPSVPVWTGTPNYNFVYQLPQQLNSTDGRIDHKINEKDSLFGRYSFLKQHRQDPPWTSNLIAGNGGFATDYRIKNQGLALGETHIFSSTSVNQARLGFSRDNAVSGAIGLPLGKSNATDYGLTGIPASPYTAGIPPIYISGFVNLGTDRFRPQYQVATVYQFVDTFNKLLGNHSLMAGYEYHRSSNNFLDLQAPQGFIQSTGIYSNKSGFGFADFLLGDVASTIYNTPLSVHNFQPGHSAFAQDTWRLARPLTVTYGVRYELFAPVLNRSNSVANFSPENGGILIPAAANSGDWGSRSLIHPDRNNIAPRLGFSFQAAPNIVFRGGYGVFYQFINRIGSESILALNQPFLRAVFTSQTAGSVTPVFQLKNGFPGATYAATSVPLYLQKNNWQDPNQRTSYVQQASFGTQFQLTPSTVVETTWVGNWGRKMNRLRNANQGVVTGYASPTQARIQFPYANLNTATTTVAGAGTHSFLELATNDGNTSYNALELSARRTMSNGLSYQVSYTWSHAMSDFADNLTAGSTPQNAYDYAHERSNSPFDQRHRFVAAAGWKLPIGKGGLLLNNSSLTSSLVGGWQLNTIVTLQTGNPINVTAADNSQTGGNHNSYANCVGNPFAGATSDRSQVASPASPLRFLSLSAFSQPGVGTFGSCRPRMYYGPGRENVDLSVFKQFRLGDVRQIELRFEAFNALNHANFGNPSASVANPATFGQITSVVGDARQIQVAGKFYF